MNIIKDPIYALIIFTITNACYTNSQACTLYSREDLYNPITIDNSSVIGFKISSISIDQNEDIFPVIMVKRNCDTGSEAKIAELPYLGDPGKVGSAFLADSDFDGTPEIFVIHRTVLYSDTGVNYGSDYFTTLVYKSSGALNYKLSERISSYFGAGGDVLSSTASDTLTYEYPYKSEAAIRNRIASAPYKAWLENKSITTRILRKTFLYDNANVADRTSKYLISGDRVQVFSQNAGWLAVVFEDKENITRGWIQCKDTLECVNHP
ncbi:hypothetical protein NA655_15680 [Pseudomonas kuykendallii]|uniref:SH3 domain-containing protein n=1 Tax=Pseudomonas kuykendallii TaxID=1007099 RepID=A0A1H3F6W6_9PSED|nr:hypothetical protein [Pseudomonas kuykendallii]MCQ4272467.1 hypothetical protein [Pseudomonas kuykendallii]SDX86726.1 hypothetical protein SAMN05216287_3950 [Pseudomonas kuykendallii]